MLVVNPILVQAACQDLPEAPGNPRLADHDDDPVAADAFARRLANQLRPGAHSGGYVDLSRPDDLTTLSERRHGEYRVCRLISRGMENSLPYFLAETAVHHDRLYEDIWVRLDGRDTLLRVEEGLTWRAMEVRRSLEASLGTENLDGKTFVRLPGYESPVATAGWWTDAHETDPAKRAATCIREIPSCEVFMAQAILDQAVYADGEDVVRIVPSSMEDREVAAVRVLRHLRLSPRVRRLVSIVVNPSGDVKKVRSWTGHGCPDGVRALIAPLRVNSRAKRLSSRLGDRIHHERAQAHRRLLQDEGGELPSPMGLDGSVPDRVAAFGRERHPIAVLAEHSRPDAGVSAVIMEQLAASVSPGCDLDSPVTVTSEHFAGTGTNNVFHLRLTTSPSRVANGDLAEIVIHLVLGRVAPEAEPYLRRLPQEFASRRIEAWKNLIEYLRIPANEPYYIIVVGRRLT